MCEIYKKTRSITQVTKVIPADKITIRAILIKRGIYNPYPHKYRRFTEREKQLILSSYKSVSSVRIAKALKCTPKAIIDFLKARGLYVSKIKEGMLEKIQQMASKQMTRKEIALALDVDYTLVSYYKKKHGIEFKPDVKKPVRISKHFMSEEDKLISTDVYLKTQNLSEAARKIDRCPSTVRNYLVKQGVHV